MKENEVELVLERFFFYKGGVCIMFFGLLFMFFIFEYIDLFFLLKGWGVDVLEGLFLCVDGGDILFLYWLGGIGGSFFLCLKFFLWGGGEGVVDVFLWIKDDGFICLSLIIE